MKFKDNAASVALYKIIGIVAVWVAVQGVALTLFAIVMMATENEQAIVTGIGGLIGGAVLLLIADYLRSIRKDMLA